MGHTRKQRVPDRTHPSKTTSIGAGPCAPRFSKTRLGRDLLRAVLLLLLPFPVSAQPADDTTAINALQCWRRLGQNTVYVGERFTMAVTCSAVETDRARTLVDEVALEPATIDVDPFEVIDGEHYEDIRTGPFRFFQYLYTLRVINETSFGEDLEIPALELSYRIERRVGTDPALVGRELTYILPAEPVRVLSLVPRDLVDIRELAPTTFGDAQTRTFRANALTLAATLLGILALGMVTLGATRIMLQRRGNAGPVEKRLPLSSIVGRAVDELAGVRETITRDEWSVESAGRALSALRIGASVALKGQVVQHAINAGRPIRDGVLQLRQGVFRQKTVAVSSGLTAATLMEPAGAGEGPAVATRETVDDLGQAIATFTAARYGRDGDLATAELTQALENGITQLTQLRWRATTLVRYATRLRATIVDWWPLSRLQER